MPATRNFFLLLGATLALFLTWFSFYRSFPEWVNVGICLWLFLLGPAILILMAREAKAEIDYENPRGMKGALLRVLVSSQLGCVGVVLMAAAAGVFGLLAYQSLVKRDFDWVESALGLGSFAVMFLFGLGLVLLAWNRSGPTREEDEEREAAWREGLVRPDWTWYEQHLGRPIPASLVRFLESWDPDADPDFELGIIPQPIQSDGCLSGGDFDLEHDFLPIAIDLSGNPIFLIPGSDQDDEIYQVLIEQPQVGAVPIAESFASFLLAQREEEDA